MTIRYWLQSAKERLLDVGIDSAWIESQLLACQVLGVERPWLVTHSEELFPTEAGEALLARRVNHEPLAYILGWREFYGRKFAVGPRVLVPRQETELLVEAALEFCGQRGKADCRILDLGTGSGCIAITLKLEKPECMLVASDISDAALGIARANALELNADVRFVQSDGFADLSNDCFDMIVTNPPYVGLSEVLPKDVSGYEPHEALFAGATGLEFYSFLATESHKHVVPNGWILLEVGYGQAATVESIFVQRGWKHVETLLDLSGIARTVICERTKSALDDS